MIIYDYVDNHIPMFNNMYMKRLKAYKQIGYEFGDGLQTLNRRLMQYMMEIIIVKIIIKICLILIRI